MRSRKEERKPLSFSTTMRNPNRIVSFLDCLLPYENQILTHEIIMEVVKSAIRSKLYTPYIVNRTPDRDAEALYQKIKEIRLQTGFSYSDEYMYEICLDLLQAGNRRNRFKMSQICGEAVDEYIRKMRTTGIISLRGSGRFIDYNTWERKKIDYILEHYTQYREFETKESYFAYMGGIDPQIVSMASAVPDDTADLRKSALQKYAGEYSRKTIYAELDKVCHKRASSDYMLKLLPAPVRLEFLTSIAMVQNFKDLDVTPNYSVDDEGLPTSTAAGGKADIVCYDMKHKSLMEVTLMCGRTDQVNNEIIPIRRHLLQEKKIFENTFSVFIAPVIHEDTKEIAEWYKYRDHIDIVTYSIEAFLAALQECETIGEMLVQRA